MWFECAPPSVWRDSPPGAPKAVAGVLAAITAAVDPGHLDRRARPCAPQPSTHGTEASRPCTCGGRRPSRGALLACLLRARNDDANRKCARRVLLVDRSFDRPLPTPSKTCGMAGYCVLVDGRPQRTTMTRRGARLSPDGWAAGDVSYAPQPQQKNVWRTPSPPGVDGSSPNIL